MKYLIVLIAFLNSLALSQEAPSFEDTSEPQATDQSITLGTLDELEEELTDAPASPPSAQSASSNSSDFDVFKPSEEISEDFSVPFPADI